SAAAACAAARRAPRARPAGPRSARAAQAPAPGRGERTRAPRGRRDPPAPPPGDTGRARWSTAEREVWSWYRSRAQVLVEELANLLLRIPVRRRIVLDRGAPSAPRFRDRGSVRDVAGVEGMVRIGVSDVDHRPALATRILGEEATRLGGGPVVLSAQEHEQRHRRAETGRV